MPDINTEFLKAVESHIMEVVHDDGAYRHLVFRGAEGLVDSFDIVTWPGHLCVCGDRGTYTFKRLDDMFELFRRADGGISPTYWAEKCVSADRDGIKVCSPAKVRSAIHAAVAEIEDSDGELWRQISDDVLTYADDEHEVRRALDGFHWNGKRIFADAWEWDFDIYMPAFLWCCHAIVWGIQQYDHVKVTNV